MAYAEVYIHKDRLLLVLYCNGGKTRGFLNVVLLIQVIPYKEGHLCEREKRKKGSILIYDSLE